MKNLFLAAMMLLSITALQSQERVSLTQTAKAVEMLESEKMQLEMDVADLKENQAADKSILETKIQGIQARLDSLDAPPPIPEGGVKIPTDENEAYSLWVFVLTLVNWLIVNVLKDKVPKWLSNQFILSIIVGAIITGVGLLFSKGEFTAMETFWFFVKISGLSNLVHQGTKLQATKPTPQSVPV